MKQFKAAHTGIPVLYLIFATALILF